MCNVKCLELFTLKNMQCGLFGVFNVKFLELSTPTNVQGKTFGVYFQIHMCNVNFLAQFFQKMCNVKISVYVM